MILLDTHVLLWQEQGDPRLGPQARRLFERALQEGHLDLSLGIDARRRDLLDQGLVEIPVDGGIAARAFRKRDPEKIRAAIDDLKAFQKAHSLGGLSVRELIEEGRKN